jgi:hypothetical protein
MTCSPFHPGGHFITGLYPWVFRTCLPPIWTRSGTFFKLLKHFAVTTDQLVPKGFFHSANHELPFDWLKKNKIRRIYGLWFRQERISFYFSLCQLKKRVCMLATQSIYTYGARKMHIPQFILRLVQNFNIWIQKINR